jgi:hypothetical protein
MIGEIGEIVLVLVAVIAVIGNLWVFQKVREGPKPPLKSDVGMLWFTAVIGVLCGIALIQAITIFLFTALIAVEMADIMRMRGVKHSRHIKPCKELNN